MPPAGSEVTRGALRGARAGVFAATALALAAGAHVFGGGTLPSLPVLVLVAVPLAWGSVVLTAKTLGPVVLTAALGTSQLVLHEALMVLAAPACVSGAMASMVEMTGHPVGLPASGACSTDLQHGMTAAAMPAAAHGIAMLVAHAVATVLTAVLLAHDDALLAWLPHLVSAVRTGWHRLVLPVTAPGPEPVVRVQSAWAVAHPWVCALDVCTDAVGRRGPPASPGTAAATA